ncbi:hypothetical protein OBBRIDRAFT_241457 [Obba rivulosa]|uniref:DUF6534 domain-containing protein n=1 Tax=Obba rivulosa TaxID=1052685 RepID=A0A8E2AW05_9APHY|nr:hypothetical protein OBBRIDRAFT_241457 [Obba rivulosa]
MSLHFDGTLGAAFLGHFVTSVLFGITSVQTWIYFGRHCKDPLSLRSLVFILWILDAVHVGLITCGMYHYLITHFGNVFVAIKPYWSIMVMIMVTNISNIIVRGIFAFRLWKRACHLNLHPQRSQQSTVSGGSVLVPIIIGFLSLYIAGDAFYFAIRGLSIPSYFTIHQFSWSLYAGFSGEVAADSIITIYQCLILRRCRTGIRSTDSVIRVLITYSINTCLLTSICAVLCLVTFALLPNLFVYFAFYFVLGKLYVNSLLANMNARGSLLENLSRPVHSLGSKAVLTGASMQMDSMEFRSTEERMSPRCLDRD